MSALQGFPGLENLMLASQGAAATSMPADAQVSSLMLSAGMPKAEAAPLEASAVAAGDGEQAGPSDPEAAAAAAAAAAEAATSAASQQARCVGTRRKGLELVQSLEFVTGVLFLLAAKDSRQQWVVTINWRRCCSAAPDLQRLNSALRDACHRCSRCNVGISCVRKSNGGAE